jgi:Family of unknown function (DUF5681)
MSKRKDTTGDDSNGYTVGYGKPPTHSRFRPGKSGNPAGRRKGVRNFGTDVKRILRVPIKVKEGARSRKISTQEGALMVLREKALKGDARSLDGLLEYASGYNNDADEIGLAQALSADDQAILAAYADEIAATAKPTTAAESPRRQRRQPKSRSNEGSAE